MIEYREIASADGDLVGTLKIDDGVLIEFKYAEGSKCMPFELSAEDLAGVTSIGQGVFGGCTRLTSIEIPEGVTDIGYQAFWYCTSLVSIEIPGSVTSIGNYAFEGCESLKCVTLSTTSENLVSQSIARNGIMGMITRTAAYSVQSAAFTLLIRSFKTALPLKDTEASLIETSKAAIDRARTFILCMLRQRDKGGLLSNVFKQQAVWCNPIIISSCINAEAIIESQYLVDRENSTIGEGTTCHGKFRFIL